MIGVLGHHCLSLLRQLLLNLGLNLLLNWRLNRRLNLRLQVGLLRQTRVSSLHWLGHVLLRVLGLSQRRRVDLSGLALAPESLLVLSWIGLGVGELGVVLSSPDAISGVKWVVLRHGRLIGVEEVHFFIAKILCGF